MAFKKIFLIFLLSFSLFSSSAANKGKCFVTQALQMKELQDNDKFWEEFSMLNGAHKIDEKSFQALIDKHSRGKVTSSPQPPRTISSINSLNSGAFNKVDIETTKRADKELAKLPRELVKKYEEFVSQVISEEGLQGLYKNPGRWHFEKLKKDDSFTVRLNKGVRVHFTMEQGKLKILEINADHVHSI